MLPYMVQTRLTVEEAGEQRQVRVLVADDSAALRSIVRITLTSQGWTVLEAETATSALEMARTLRPDLVLLDISFGETGPDGLAICAEIKDDPLTRAIPVVMLTAHDDPAQRRRAMAAGADAFVAKPFGPLELMQVLQALLPEPPRVTPRTPRARLVLIDDHSAIREGLRSLILGEDHLEIVAEATNAEDGLRLARRLRPDVVVLDEQMPGGSGLDLLPELRLELPNAKLVMFSLDHGVRERALAQGASVFLPKDASIDEILAALQPSSPVATASARSMTRPRPPTAVAVAVGGALVAIAAIILIITAPALSIDGRVIGTLILAALCVGAVAAPRLRGRGRPPRAVRDRRGSGSSSAAPSTGTRE